MEKDWLVVLETDKMWQAEMAREILENEGIEAVIVNQKDSSYLTFGSIQVYVHQHNEQKSLKLLEELKH